MTRTKTSKTSKTSKTPNEPLKEFYRLFRVARREMRRAKTKATSEGPAYQAALQFAREHGLGGADVLLEAYRLRWLDEKNSTEHKEKSLKLLESRQAEISPALEGLQSSIQGIVFATLKQHERAIEAYNKALADPNYDRHGDTWDNIGLVYNELKQHERAIEAYNKALADPNYDRHGDTWNNLGIVYDELKQYDEAIEAYQKALEDPNFDTPGYAWNNLGIVHTNLKQYDKAIEASQKALEDPNFDTPGYAWNNLGVVYGELEQHDKEIEAYQKALEDPNYDTPGNAWVNLGSLYIKLGESGKAETALNNALLAQGDEYVKSRVEILRSLLASKLTPESLNRSDRAILNQASKSSDDYNEPEQRILNKLQRAEQSKYEDYLEKPSSNRDNVLSTLRGWSSAVTLLEGSERLWRGGGYFLKWQGKGIVIDPGFDFIRNLHDAGYHGREIDVILVSHNHPDHNSDLVNLDDLRYELYKRRNSDPHGGVSPYALIWDDDSNRAINFSSPKPQHQHRPAKFDLGHSQPTHNSPHDLPFSVTYFEVKHGDLHNAVGFRLTLHSETGDAFTLGYTGDTEYFAELPEHLKNCDVLLAHISQPDIEEFSDASRRKKIHLGYRGLGELIKEAKPKLTLVGEFWAGLADLRIDLVQGLRGIANTNAILPAGLGLNIALPGMEIECTECTTKVPFDRIQVAPPADRFGNLSYLCPNCLLHNRL